MDIRVVKKPASGARIEFVTRSDGEEAIKDFEATRGAVAVRYHGDDTVIYCGLGESTACASRALRSAAAAGMRKAIALKRTKVSVIVPQLDCCEAGCAAAALEGAVLGAYSFSAATDKKPRTVPRIELVTNALPQAQARAVATLCECVWYARDLVNGNASEIHPERLAREARAIAGRGRLKLEILDEKAIRSKGLRLLAAVGQASPYPPRLILMSYTGAPRSPRVTAVVGKGITFDSGGQNLKPTGSIETMRGDMAGAAAVLGLMKALVTLSPAVNVLGVVPAAHNAVGGKAYFPGDIYRAHDGTTVEITSTDAEGRLVLADAFSYAKKRHAPAEIIDLATLTGSVVMALGDTVAGLFATSETLAGRLFQAGETTGERLWRMPLYEEYGESMKSDIADLRNTSKWKRGMAGSITGAAFLARFAGDTPWAHLDIAGTAFNEGEARGDVPKYGTGFGVRLLWEYLTRR